MSMTLKQLKTKLLAAYPGRDWDQMCQRLVWNVSWLTSGVPESQMRTYASARSARIGSSLVPRGANEFIEQYVSRAPAGAVHYWEYGEFGHNGVSLNGLGVDDRLMLHTSDHASNVDRWAPHMFIAPVLSYSLGTYRGWSVQNGVNPVIALVPESIDGNQRRVNAGGVFARKEPTRQSVKGVLRKPGEVVTMGAFSFGETVDANLVWFLGVDGWWYWSGGFEDKGTHDLEDVTPIPPVVPPVVVPPVVPKPDPVPPVDPPVAEPGTPDIPELPPVPPVNLWGIVVALVVAVGAIIAGIIGGIFQ